MLMTVMVMMTTVVVKVMVVVVVALHFRIVVLRVVANAVACGCST